MNPSSMDLTILNYFSVYFTGEDDMDDVPLAHRLKSQRVEKTGEKRKLGAKTMRKEDLNVESSRKKATAHRKESHLKRNQV